MTTTDQRALTSAEAAPGARAAADAAPGGAAGTPGGTPADARRLAPDPEAAAAEPAPAVSSQQKLLDQLGGTRGMVCTAIPVAAFVAADAAVPLPIAIGVALALAAAITVWRMVRGERFATAVGGLVGVATAGGVSAWTGSAGDFFLIGIWASFAGALVLLGSLLARRPLTGVLWNVSHGNTYAWRGDRPSLLAHDVATGTLTVLLAARFAVQQWLYLSDATGWLAVAKIAMGTPLLAPALLVVFWSFRRSTRRLVR
ncbi:DUF3159 domain-containing protein [Streptomyces sp. WMMB303]|uniref:DUF3159 domain-containing protein n=1 Tax=Streptomyces sp. WMMB303 TaxID=3034154 RepID=UPI0023EB2005|nr:DUF3159 domain-containing protein [Streptomyces sp. WMMB303]MDF4251679.1 DUF3159 domain-containing protein [Streptomyces sp. WMMB303]